MRLISSCNRIAMILFFELPHCWPSKAPSWKHHDESVFLIYSFLEWIQFTKQMACLCVPCFVHLGLVSSWPHDGDGGGRRTKKNDARCAMSPGLCIKYRCRTRHSNASHSLAIVYPGCCSSFFSKNRPRNVTCNMAVKKMSISACQLQYNVESSEPRHFLLLVVLV